MSSTPDDVDPDPDRSILDPTPADPTPADPAPLDPEKLLREAAAGLPPGSEADAGRGGEESAGRPAWTLPDLAALTALFPELRIDGLVGRGGMGAVYVAVQERLGRQVALKILPRELAADPAFEERFQREAQALAGLQHPRILTLYDFGQREGLFYLVTDFVEGMNLRQLMDMGRLSPAEALRIAPQICEALQFAHDQGIVHRDIKPENILVDTEGEVHIADFGLARFLGPPGAAPQLTRSTQILGTPQYMAPEQWQGLTVDHRADIFAVGIVLYEMLTGQVPMGHYSPPSESPGVPPRLDEVVKRSLAQKPEQRYQQMSEVADALTLARPRKLRGHQKGRPERLRAVSGLVWLYLILLVLALYGSYEVAQEFGDYRRPSASPPFSRELFSNPWEYDQWLANERADLEGKAPFRYSLPVLRRPGARMLAGIFLPNPLLLWLTICSGLLFLLSTGSGWRALAKIRHRKRSRRGLAQALVMAWAGPAVLLTTGPIWVLLELFRFNYVGFVLSLNLLFLVGCIAFLAWIRYQHRWISEEVQAKARLSPVVRMRSSARRMWAARRREPPRVLRLGWLCLLLLGLGTLHTCDVVDEVGVAQSQRAAEQWQLGVKERQAWALRKQEAYGRGEDFTEEFTPVTPVRRARGLLTFIPSCFTYRSMGLIALFTAVGWFALARIRERRQGTRGLVTALFMAWGFPMLLFVVVPSYVLLTMLWYRQDLAISVATLLFLVLFILDFLWFVHLHRRYRTELASSTPSRRSSHSLAGVPPP